MSEPKLLGNYKRSAWTPCKACDDDGHVPLTPEVEGRNVYWTCPHGVVWEHQRITISPDKTA